MHGKWANLYEIYKEFEKENTNKSQNSKRNYNTYYKIQKIVKKYNMVTKLHCQGEMEKFIETYKKYSKIESVGFLFWLVWFFSINSGKMWKLSGDFTLSSN